MEEEREACGRCSMSTAVDVARSGREADDAERDPFGEARIEVDADELRTLSPGTWLSGVSSRLNDAIDRFTWGR
ncbi:hypothetical protein CHINAEXTREME_08575 [Halobiforma lacisalsi AJ5]|uniref:Uncharacterized protein n=1 Tax=Natronobacterium lacisalsi AJ5 TaxID=358396 RepID=M0LVB4_NATLA|nr:hypothetical protein [Halobiforma lacisalsi]APW97830.1 hypothetical protein CHINAEXTREME_08575 [Halobiforma lacisalsi AJ5]EMA37421.1 hypothetical protein C445_00991 [Halobiforma lacisalsi AJ5]